MLDPGQILDSKYEIIKVLGRGGMGTVYLCKNSRLGNFWAVKEVNSQWKDQVDFLAEPNMLKNLSHSGIVRIVDIFYEDDNLYIVEDYIEGKTLKEHVTANGPLSSESVVDLSLQLCSILDYLHSFNPPIIYRDLKPSNIMIKPDNKVVLIDFGIARTYKDHQESDTMILGSRGYIAPEQLANTQSNAQTDIYSLGSTMFFMLTGKSKSLPADIMLEANYPEHAAKSLINVIQKASAADPVSRYDDVKLMMSELDAAVADSEYDKTMLMGAYELSDEATRTVPIAPKKPKEPKESKKRNRLMTIPVLACVIAAVIFLALLLSNNPGSDKKTEESPVAPTTEAVEQDTVVKGILDSNNPVVLSSGNDHPKDKGKGRNKIQNVQFVLNPAASVSNSKLSVSLLSIESIDEECIVVLSIKNSADPALKLDLSKTYLVNGKNEAAEADNQDSNNLMSIPQSPSDQEVRLTFEDFKFEGSPYTLKTVLSSVVDKDINLVVDIE